MVLAIDIGNTNIVIGVFEDDKIIFCDRISTNINLTSMEYTILIKNLLEINNLNSGSFEGGIISSVVPQVTQNVKDAMSRLVKKDIIVVGAGIKTGLNILLDTPSQLGSDRVADAVAAMHYFSVPCIIIDMGTATTISVIDKNKNFIGGAIMPGLYTALNSLSLKASQLSNISLTPPPKKVIGSNTADCMRSGVLFGTAASVDGIIDRIETELGEKCQVVSTGGIANTVIPHCKHEIFVDNELLLKGLMIIYNKNI